MGADIEVTYVLGGFDLDPSAVTAATLLEPTGVTLRGVPISPSSPLKPKASFWHIRIWRERRWEIESTVRELLAILAPAASQLRAFADRYEATVRVVVDPVEGHPGPRPWPRPDPHDGRSRRRDRHRRSHRLPAGRDPVGTPEQMSAEVARRS